MVHYIYIYIYIYTHVLGDQKVKIPPNTRFNLQRERKDGFRTESSETEIRERTER